VKEQLIQGTILGLSAGFAPGPLLTLVVTETLRHGTAAGVRVALAPLVTDVPIVAASLFLLGGLAARGEILGLLGIGGALFVSYLGWENLRTKGTALDVTDEPSRSFRRGVAVNALSPYPYLFWLTVGGPITMKALDGGEARAAAFAGSFYLLLVGSKVALALAVGKSRGFLRGRSYVLIMRLLGLLLILLALSLFRDALGLLTGG